MREYQSSLLKFFQSVLNLLMLPFDLEIDSNDSEKLSFVAKVLTILGGYEARVKAEDERSRDQSPFSRETRGGDGSTSNNAGMYVERDATR